MITFPFQTDDWHTLALTAYEDVVRLEAPLKRQAWHVKQQKLEQDTRDYESMRGFYKVINERHEGLTRVQELYHQQNPFIFNTIMGIHE
jgi:hypothetical protein